MPSINCGQWLVLGEDGPLMKTVGNLILAIFLYRNLSIISMNSFYAFFTSRY